MTEIGSIVQHLLQFSPDSLLVVDQQGIIRYANDTANALFGYTPQQLVGQSLELLIPDRFRLRHGAHVAGFLHAPSNREMGARIADLYARRADGTEFPAGIRLAPLDNDQGRFIAVAVRDMTERRAISDALVAAREEADRANRAKSRFLATASHDLRQPLHAVRLLNASLLTLTRDNPQLHELLERQEYAIDGATRLLNALLDISRLESGAIDPQLTPVRVAGIFADLAREFEPSAASKRLDLRFADTPVVLMTDRMLFTQLLQNLIGNALKYTERGYVKVSQALEGDFVVLKVEDSGIGIPPDKLDRIFDEYYQVDPRGGQRAGVGLGLAIVREVSRLLGYTVSVDSKPGEGTRVRVSVPRQKLMSDSPVAAGEPRPGAAAAAARHSRIVLLEDNPSVRIATELFLQLEGYEVHSAASAAEAEPLLAKMEPADVLITDYRLDGAVTGLEVLQQVRARQGREVPAILLSGDLESMMRVIKSPPSRCRFLSKPVDTKALIEVITELGPH